MAHSTLRCPSRSPAKPNMGAISVPTYCSEPYTVSSSTDPVAVRMYQPRIRFSISKPHEVSRSAGNWNRKLRTPNGARTSDRLLRPGWFIGEALAILPIRDGAAIGPGHEALSPGFRCRRRGHMDG